MKKLEVKWLHTCCANGAKNLIDLISFCKNENIELKYECISVIRSKNKKWLEARNIDRKMVESGEYVFLEDDKKLYKISDIIANLNT